MAAKVEPKKPATPKMQQLITEIKGLVDRSVPRWQASKLREFPGCCGINVLTHISYRTLSAGWLAATLGVYLGWQGSTAGLIFASDNRARPDLEALGFTLYNKFVNPKTRRIIYTYQARWIDTFGHVSRAMCKRKLIR
jgi:hypothetical protein